MSAVSEEERVRRARIPAVLDYAFRPMFLAAGSWAVIALALWLAMFFGYVQLPTRFDPLAWHVHEMLFGFVMAAVAGFLLTAIPNWTGRLPVRGYPLATLACLWLLGRLASLISADLPAWLAILADLAFPTALLAVAAREIITGRNWRNLPMTAPLMLFIIADLLMHLESLGLSVPVGLGWRLAVGAPIVLISVIGGRIIPSFTRNWLFKRKSPRLPSPQDMLDTAAVGVLAVALILWAFLPDHRVTGALLISAALLNAVRLGRWAGIASWPEPLLFILHIGYAWLVLGVALLGLSIFNIGVPAASAIHALTAGATAVMILAVMPRVTLGHTGRADGQPGHGRRLCSYQRRRRRPRLCLLAYRIHDDTASRCRRMLDCGVWPVRAGLWPDAADAAVHVMSKQPPPQEAPWPEGAIFTVGHSTLPIEQFITLLHTYGIACVADNRNSINGNMASYAAVGMTADRQ